MEHWASAVIEAVDNSPKTPPPSPAMSPQTTPHAVFGSCSLVADQAGTIDIKLDRLHAASSSNPVNIIAKRPIIDKQPTCSISEDSPTAKPTPWRLYAALLAGLFQQSLSTGLIMTYGTILSYYTTNLLRSTNSTKLNLIGALPAFLLLALALPTGYLLDRNQHRRLNILAALLIPLSLLSLAFTTTHSPPIGGLRGRYYAVLLCTIPLGLGQSIFFLSSSHMARTWLPKRTGVALGVVNAGAALGGTVFPPLFTTLTNRHSFQLAMLMLAVIAAASSIFVIIFSVPHPLNFKPASAGAPSPTTRQSLQDLTPIRRRSSLLHQLSKPRFILFTLAICTIYAGVLSIPFYLPAWSLTVLPPHPQPRVSLVTIMNAAQLPGRVVASVLADYVQARWLHVGVLMVAGVCVVPFWLGVQGMGKGKGEQAGVGAAHSFAVVYGLLHGGLVALVANDVQELLQEEQNGAGDAERSGAVAPETDECSVGNEGHGCGDYGQLSGLVYTFAAPFMLCGPLVSGQLVDTLGMTAVGVWSAGCFGLGALLLGVSLVAGGSGDKKRGLVPGQVGEPVQVQHFGGVVDPSEEQDMGTKKGDSWSLGRWRVAIGKEDDDF